MFITFSLPCQESATGKIRRKCGTPASGSVQRMAELVRERSSTTDTVPASQGQPAWWTKECFNSMVARNAAWRERRRNPCESTHIAFASKRNHFHRVCLHAKKDLENVSADVQWQASEDHYDGQVFYNPVMFVDVTNPSILCDSSLAVGMWPVLPVSDASPQELLPVSDASSQESFLMAKQQAQMAASASAESFKTLQEQYPDVCISVGTIGHPDTCGWACRFMKRDAGCNGGTACPKCHLCEWSKTILKMESTAKKLICTAATTETQNVDAEPS